MTPSPGGSRTAVPSTNAASTLVMPFPVELPRFERATAPSGQPQPHRCRGDAAGPHRSAQRLPRDDRPDDLERNSVVPDPARRADRRSALGALLARGQIHCHDVEFDRGHGRIAVPHFAGIRAICAAREMTTAPDPGGMTRLCRAREVGGSACHSEFEWTPWLTFAGCHRPTPIYGTGNCGRRAAGWTARSSFIPRGTGTGQGTARSPRQGRVPILPGPATVPCARPGRPGALRHLGWPVEARSGPDHRAGQRTGARAAGRQHRADPGGHA
jgi:hypothetical protein